VEVGEPLAAVAKRFRNAGLTEAGVAKRMDAPLESVRQWLK
jgi:lactoylglutathione lyase